ncbi:MAG: DUF748 domain-containing protein, partial [Candidatus Rokuibacteriota bacterium]
MGGTRFLKIVLIASVSLVILGGAFLWALPEIIRRVALDQIPKRTGRAVAIEDIDLNLFTGRAAVKNFRLAERQGPDAFVEAERLDADLATTALLRSDVRLTSVNLVAPSVRVVRTGPAEFNFSDLLQPAADAPPKPEPGPSRWTVTVDRLTVSRGTVRALDQAVSPAAEWLVRDFGVDLAGITTKAGAPPGRLAVQAKIDDAALDVKAEPLRLEPLKADVKVALDGFEIVRVNPYVFTTTPYRPKGGRLALALGATVDHAGEELTKATVSGTVTVERGAVVQTGKDDPFFGLSRLAVEVKEADALRRSLTVASVGIEGLDLKARRDARGVIDLIEIFLAKPAAAASPAPGQARVEPARAPA